MFVIIVIMLMQTVAFLDVVTQKRREELRALHLELENEEIEEMLKAEQQVI
jgi:hypothetical protein